MATRVDLIHGWDRKYDQVDLLRSRDKELYDQIDLICDRNRGWDRYIYDNPQHPIHETNKDEILCAPILKNIYNDPEAIFEVSILLFF
jgi:hypothetical protein